MDYQNQSVYCEGGPLTNSMRLRPNYATTPYGPGNFVIDWCGECSRVWLDGGELDRAATVKWGGTLWD